MSDIVRREGGRKDVEEKKGGGGHTKLALPLLFFLALILEII